MKRWHLVMLFVVAVIVTASVMVVPRALAHYRAGQAVTELSGYDPAAAEMKARRALYLACPQGQTAFEQARYEATILFRQTERPISFDPPLRDAVVLEFDLARLAGMQPGSRIAYLSSLDTVPSGQFVVIDGVRHRLEFDDHEPAGAYVVLIDVPERPEYASLGELSARQGEASSMEPGTIGRMQVFRGGQVVCGALVREDGSAQ